MGVGMFFTNSNNKQINALQTTIQPTYPAPPPVMTMTANPTISHSVPANGKHPNESPALHRDEAALDEQSGLRYRGPSNR